MFVIDNVDNPLATVGAITERGKQTIEILKLNREALIDKRAAETLKFFRELDITFLTQLQLEMATHKKEPLLKEFIDKLETGRTEYSMAKLAAVKVWQENLESRLAEIFKGA